MGTLFRIFLIASVSLLTCVAIKPRRGDLDKLSHDIIVSLDEKGELSHSVQVEPPEDVDEIQYVADPRMSIRDNLLGTEQEKQHLKPEVKEEARPLVHHEIKTKAAPSAKGIRRHLQPEKDMDDIYHRDASIPVFHPEDTKASAAAVKVPFQRRHLEPEVDMDHLYHP